MVAAPSAPPHAEESRTSRSVAQLMIALALFGAVALLLASLSLYHATAESPAKETLRRATAALTEIDALVARDYDDLQDFASDPGPDGVIRVEAYPIDVPLGPDEVAGRTPAEITDTLLDRSADALYARGTSELRVVSQGRDDIGVFSATGLTDNALGFLRERNHTALGFATFVLAVICAALAVALLVLARGPSGLTAVGAVVLVASLPLLVAGVAGRLGARAAGGGNAEYVRREFMDITDSLAWIAIRDALAFAAFGVLLVVIGVALSAAAGRTRAR
jgi:hypothetical protein